MSLGKKHTQSIPRPVLKKLLAVARGDEAGDTLIKNIKILDLINGDIYESAIMIEDQWIAGVGIEYLDQKARNIIDGEGRVVVPGFIDAHLHIESSMMHPFEFERLTLPLGTTTAICDPHEITNVMGDKGFSWFLRCSELSHQNIFIQTSSCVPALKGFETVGGEFELEHMAKYKNHSNVLGLAEMMNFPGVINGDDSVLDKILEFEGMNLDGHAPLLRGKGLNAYLCAGIQNCHETVTLEEGKEKLQKGMSLIIREGSVAKNLETLIPLVSEFNSSQCLLCTDDRNPFEIFEEGHINYMIKKMINDYHIAPHVAYRLSSFSSAKHFGLKRLGLLAPGKKADIVFLEDYKSVSIHDVMIGGQFVSELGLDKEVGTKLEKSLPPRENTIKRVSVSQDDFQYSLINNKEYNLIEIIPEEIITNHLTTVWKDGTFDQEDVKKIAVVERHGKGLDPTIGFVKGSGLKKGAIASSVAHDSHNIIVIGADEQSMATAVNALISSQGGFCVTEGSDVKALLELPIAGLISLETGEAITQKIKNLKFEFKKLGVTLEEPFLQMAFLALPVIPSLKITDMGLVDVSKFAFTSLEVN